jgi:hypothetical protein
MRFCDFSTKAISNAQGTLAIFENLAILQFKLESESNSTRDTNDFGDSCDFAILARKRSHITQGLL